MIHRRQFLKISGAALATLPALNSIATKALTLEAGSSVSKLIQRAIPRSGELVPVIGMGTSRTFDVANSPQTLAQLSEVIRFFIEGNGRIIDTSPMYGQAESRVGDVMATFENPPPMFNATKVWTSGKKEGIAQMEESARRMRIKHFDLIAVHNLTDWRTQLATLKEWKAEGKVRYIGITTSHGRDHDELTEIMKSQPLDFVQFSYNIEDRTAEKTLLPLAMDKGIATMINRPYQRGSLFRQSKGKELPDVARDIDCNSWGQFYLKFILSHPAATCIIPATSKAKHMADNMQANFGRVPDSSQRTEMLRVFEAL